MIKRKSLIISVASATLLLIISFAPALIGSYQIKQQLQQMGAEQVELQSLYLNPWTGYLKLEGLHASSIDQPPLTIGRFETQVSYRALWSKRLQITLLNLADTQLHLRQQAQLWQIGPLLLPPPTEEQSEQPPTEWRWGLDSYQISNLSASLTTPTMSHRLRIDDSALQLLKQWTPQQHTEISLHGALNDSPLSLDTRGTPLASLPRLELELKLQQLDIAPLAAPWVEGLAGSLSTDLILQLEQLDNGFRLSQSGNLTLDSFGYQSASLAASSAQISWQGSAEQLLEDSQLTLANADSSLNIDRLELQQEQLKLKEDAIALTGQLKAEALQHFSFDGNLTTVQGQLQLDTLELSNKGRSWQGKVDAQLDDQGLQQLITDGALRLQQLQLKQPGLALNEQQIALDGRLETDLKQLQFDGQLATQPSTIAYQHLQIDNQSRLWQGMLELDLASTALTSLSGDIEIGKLQVRHQDGEGLLRFDQLQLSQLGSPTPNHVALAALELDQFQLGEKQPLLKLDRLTINQLKAGASATRIGQIHPNKLHAFVDLDESKQPYRWNSWLAKLTGDQADPVTTDVSPQQEVTAAQQQPPYPFALGQFKLLQPAQIELTERSLKTNKPGKPVKLTLSTLKFEQIDSRSDQVSPFELKAQANRYGDINLKGDYALFAQDPDAQWQAQVTKLSLPPFSRLMRAQTGYQIQSGKLALNSDGSIKKGHVDSSNHLTINNFVVEPASKGATDEFDGRMGMPLGTAVSLLTDSDDNVELDLPVTGELSDPEFGVQSVVNIVMAKVAREAAMGYLTVTLQPYGALLSLGRMAANAVEGSAINLDPVYFEPGSAALTPQGTDYLNKIAGMLNERKGLRLKLCGQSVAADHQWLLFQQAQPTSAGSVSAAAASTAPIPLTDLEREQLLQLAEDRGFAVKEHLIAQLKVDDGQLFSCLAKVDENFEGQPQVRLGL